jgi:hypothetical protein
VPGSRDLGGGVEQPRLHTPDREKIWVACSEHKKSLADYLAVRSFLKRVEPLQAGY